MAAGVRVVGSQLYQSCMGFLVLQNPALGALCWKSLVLLLGQWQESRFWDSPGGWLFIFLCLGCLICKMGMVITPTSWHCWEVKTTAFLGIIPRSSAATQERR